MVFTTKRPIEPTWGFLQDVWISLTLSLETRSMSQTRMPGFLPACLLCHGASQPPKPACLCPSQSQKASEVPRVQWQILQDLALVGLGGLSRSRGALLLWGLGFWWSFLTCCLRVRDTDSSVYPRAWGSKGKTARVFNSGISWRTKPPNSPYVLLAV